MAEHATVGDLKHQRNKEARVQERGSQVLSCAGVGRRLVELIIDKDLLPVELHEWLRFADRGASMVLAGPPGSGKTVTAIAAVRLHVAAEIQRTGVWGTPYRLSYSKAVGLYRAVFEQDQPTLRAARSADLLIIDDLGAAYEHEWPVSEVEDIVDERWEDSRPTIVTTNLHPDGVEDSLKARLPRSFDRLTGDPGPGVVILDRPSMRRA